MRERAFERLLLGGTMARACAQKWGAMTYAFEVTIRQWQIAEALAHAGIAVDLPTALVLVQYAACVAAQAEPSTAGQVSFVGFSLETIEAAFVRARGRRS